MVQLNDRADQRKSHASLIPVIVGERCIGHLVARGKEGFEAFDSDSKSLGTFADEHDAVAMLMKAAP